MVEIAKAVGADAKVLIMDEPTASLADARGRTPVRDHRQLRAQGVGIIYISHRLEEVFAIADRITVLRDGEHGGDPRRRRRSTRDELDPDDGRPRADRASFRSATVAPGDVVLELRQLSEPRASASATCRSRCARGEILGLAGLVGSGRTELAETLFGLAPADGGEILLRGAPVRIDSPARRDSRSASPTCPRIGARHGVVLGDADRRRTPRWRASARSRRRGLIDRRAPSERSAERLRRAPAHQDAVGVDAESASLSGGNQQKVALARWLATEPRVLILDEPTQGVDVGAKAEIHAHDRASWRSRGSRSS